MGKKNFLIIGAITVFFIIAIILIFTLNNNKNTWISNILKSQNYEITMIDCNNREKKLKNETLNILSNKWNKMSNNGPWTGDPNTCYTKINISYENNGIINQVNIIIIDKNSLVLELGTETIYYTNSEEIINELNGAFKE